MTRIDAARCTLALLLLTALLVVGGCGGEVEVFPEPGGASESAQIHRTAAEGPILIAFSPFPLRGDAPPDGVRRAVIQAVGRNLPCSAAIFYWTEKTMAERWLREQMDLRRRAGQPVRLILAGHGLGATEAAETARDILIRDDSAEILLLVTVDAVKPGRINHAAGAAGAAVAKRIPGVNVNLIAYDSAPAPDGLRFRTHINYYQSGNAVYHGVAMPGAENHFLDDWTGYLTHGNIDDFAAPLVTADIRAALSRGAR